MKYPLIIILILILMAASFAVGWMIPKNEKAPQPSDEPDVLQKEDDLSEPSDTLERNVFFSPETGSDETGDGSKGDPFKTYEKAKSHADGLLPEPNEKIVILEFLMSVDVRTQSAYGVNGINMIPFTGSSDGPYFSGEIVGTGCDTQKYGMGSPTFSARYMLKGKDYKGQDCSIFIENEGDSLEKCTPFIATDSRALSEWQNYDLRTIVTPVSTGVIVDMYRIH